MVAESITLIHESHYPEAIEVLEGNGWTAALQPMRSFLLATAESGRGRMPEALRHLTECIRMAPGLALEAAANPHLSSLVVRASKAARDPT